MGLLRGIARTAVISGTATAVSNNVSRRQAARWSEQEQPQQGYAEPTQAAPQDDVYDQIAKLGQLRDQGILTEDEFNAKKQQLLGL